MVANLATQLRHVYGSPTLAATFGKSTNLESEHNMAVGMDTVPRAYAASAVFQSIKQCIAYSQHRRTSLHRNFEMLLYINGTQRTHEHTHTHTPPYIYFSLKLKANIILLFDGIISLPEASF